MTPALPQSVISTITTVLPTMLGWCTVEKGIRLAELVWEQRNLVRPPYGVGPLCSVELGVHGCKSGGVVETEEETLGGLPAVAAGQGGRGAVRRAQCAIGQA